MRVSIYDREYRSREEVRRRMEELGAGRLDAFDARENAEGGHILGTGD